MAVDSGGPAIYYRRPILIVSDRECNARYVARSLEFDDREWRPITSAHALNGYAVQAAIFDETSWRLSPDADLIEQLTLVKARRRVHVARAALQGYRARTRAQVLHAMDGEQSGSERVPYGQDADILGWGCPTVTIHGHVAELEQYSVQERLIEATAKIQGADGSKLTVCVRRPDAIEQLIARHRDAELGDFHFLQDEVRGTERPQRSRVGEQTVTIDLDHLRLPEILRRDRDGDNGMGASIPTLRTLHNQQPHREQGRAARESFPVTVDPVLAQVVQLSQTTGISLSDALTAMAQVQSAMRGEAVSADNTERVMQDIRSILDADGQLPVPLSDHDQLDDDEQTSMSEDVVDQGWQRANAPEAHGRPAGGPRRQPRRQPPRFEPPKRKIDLED